MKQELTENDQFTMEWALSWIPNSTTSTQQKILATGLRDVVNAVLVDKKKMVESAQQEMGEQMEVNDVLQRNLVVTINALKRISAGEQDAFNISDAALAEISQNRLQNLDTSDGYTAFGFKHNTP